MSRIGKLPIPVPSGTDVTIAQDGATVTVKGPKGMLSKTLPRVTVSCNDGIISVVANGTTREDRACHGLSRALLNNMVIGCSQGHRRTLMIVGTGYKADTSGQKMTLSLGFSHPVIYNLPKGISAKVEDRGTRIDLEGADKELLGHVASVIRGYRPPEPYKGKGVRYADEVIRRKAGKAGKAA
jgi:large subunit ribosomal protein L6